MGRHPCLLELVFLFLLSCLVVSFGCSKRNEPGPLTPQQAILSFRIKNDLAIELFATEPHVVDPVEIVWDEDGNAFAAEMLDYPTDPPPGVLPRSRIRLLQDLDGDGRIDHSIIFAEHLLQVTSLLPWNHGLLVTAAPEILFLKDSDGDGRADIRRVLFTGFAQGSSEHRVSSLRFGLDNWIYAGNDGQPGQIRFMERPEAPAISISGGDFRFRLDRGFFEAESGPAQFGLTFDEWGHRFLTQNTVHIRQALIPMRYLKRNPYLAASVSALDISDHGQPSSPIFPLTRPQQWREERTRLRQKRNEENQSSRVEYAGGYFTAASGGTLYSGDQLPPAYRGNLFTGDVSANLVHRDVLKNSEGHLVAQRASDEQNQEFLASTDPWFRPCNFGVGPDGNLYVVDIYREFIEGPEFIPEELRKGMNFYSGDTLGRIYRIVPRGGAKKRAPPRLSAADSSLLVQSLSDPNGWVRFTAQRLLGERHDVSAVPLLKKKALEDPNVLGRLHALYSLEALSSLDAPLLERAIGDHDSHIREHAVHLAESFPQLLPRLLSLVDDPSKEVRFQLALSLGEFPGDAATVCLARLALAHAEDSWFRTAILTSRNGSSTSLLKAMLLEKDLSARTSQLTGFLRELAAVIGARNSSDEIAELAALMLNSPALAGTDSQIGVLEGLVRGFQLAGVNGLHVAHCDKWLLRSIQSSSEPLQLAARNTARFLSLPSFLNRARADIRDPAVSGERRRLAILLLASGKWTEVRHDFEELLDTPLEPDLTKAALQCLATFDEPEAGNLIVSVWKNFAPGLRDIALDGLLSRSTGIAIILTALERGQMERSAIDPARKAKLTASADLELKKRAEHFFGNDISDRGQIVASYARYQGHSGNSQEGKVLFEKHCSTCHLVRAGHRIGPDLSGVSSNTKAQLLQSILDPSATIEPRFLNYIVITKEGRIHDGLIVAETPASFTLRRSEADDEPVLRSRIRELRSSNVSLMPEGFEKDISPEGMADLIAYLQGGVSR